MIFAADYPLMDVIWTLLVFFLWVMWFWCLIIVLTDVFGRTDIGGWAKAAWTLFLLIVPVIGMLVYLIAQGKEMAERRTRTVVQAQERYDDHIRSVVATPGNGKGGGAAAEIASAKQLLDSGAIDAAEFDQLKRRALAV